MSSATLTNNLLNEKMLDVECFAPS